METLIAFLETLNKLSPLAVIALLATVIYIQVWKQPSSKDLVEVKDNHLHELPAMAESLRRVENLLIEIRTILNQK